MNFILTYNISIVKIPIKNIGVEVFKLGSSIGRDASDRRMKKIILTGLMIAMVFVVTYFTKIPGPVGYFNLGDAAIIIAAVMLGRNCGFIAGALGSALADLLGGYIIFAPITFFVKGLEGFIVGYIIYKFMSKEAPKEAIVRLIAVVAGCAFMIVGYFLGEAYILRVISAEYGLTKAIMDLPFNVVQGVASAIVGYLIVTALVKTKVLDYILE